MVVNSFKTGEISIGVDMSTSLMLVHDGPGGVCSISSVDIGWVSEVSIARSCNLLYTINPVIGGVQYLSVNRRASAAVSAMTIGALFSVWSTFTSSLDGDSNSKALDDFRRSLEMADLLTGKIPVFMKLLIILYGAKKSHLSLSQFGSEIFLANRFPGTLLSIALDRYLPFLLQQA